MQRRSFLKLMLASASAPAIVRASNLMPIVPIKSPIVAQPPDIFVGSGCCSAGTVFPPFPHVGDLTLIDRTRLYVFTGNQWERVENSFHSSRMLAFVSPFENQFRSF
jgi:hypothetical protein